MLLTKALTSLSLTALICTTACGSALDVHNPYDEDAQEDEGLSQSIINGTVTSKRTEVGLMRYSVPTKQGTFPCTATLVSERVAITARHCAAHTTCLSGDCSKTLDASITFESDSPNPIFTQFKVVAFESYDLKGAIPAGVVRNSSQVFYKERPDFFFADDVALLLLDRAVPSNVAKPARLLDVEPKTGTPLRVWGYGCTTLGQGIDQFKRYFDFAVGKRIVSTCGGDSGGPITVGADGAIAFLTTGLLNRDNKPFTTVVTELGRYMPLLKKRAQAWGQRITVAPAYDTQEFTDVRNHWAGNIINNLRRRELVSGFGDGRFQPDATVTRAQYAALINNAFLKEAEARRADFSDTRGHWASDAIRKAAAAGYLSGYSDGSFKPDQSITRQEMLVSLASGLKLSGANSGTLSSYQDNGSVASWARNGVGQAIHNGLLEPEVRVFGKKVRPTAPVKRGEMAAFIFAATEPK